jgi:hypothetical protein
MFEGGEKPCDLLWCFRGTLIRWTMDGLWVGEPMSQP